MTSEAKQTKRGRVLDTSIVATLTFAATLLISFRFLFRIFAYGRWSLIAFLCAEVAIVAYGFRTDAPQRRRRAWTVAITLVISLAVIAGGVYLALYIYFGQEPPTLTELQSKFPSREQDLETLLRMSNEDSRYSRIAVDFLDDDQAPDGPARQMEGDGNIALPAARWNKYRKLYKHNHIHLGIQRNRAGDAFIMLDSIGLLDRGHTTGYLYCSDRLTPAEDSHYPPCLLGQDHGRKPEDNLGEAYGFQHLQGNWYAFDEGPG